MQRKEVKKENIIQFTVTIATVLLIVIISNFLFTRIDLTSDKRFTLSQHTKQSIKELDDILYFKIYLDGDLPAGFKRLQNATGELINELRNIENDKIQFEFIDPAESPNKKTRNEIFKQLYEKGLQPTNLQVKESDGSSSQKIIFPGLLISYRGEEVPVNILKNYSEQSSESNLNASVQALEYEILFAIKQLTQKTKPKIGFIEGHGELNKLEVDDIANYLDEMYKIERVKVNEYIYSLRDSLGKNKYDLIIIAKPNSSFSEKDKYLIDQYIMNGGNSMWLIDNVSINIDSLAYSRSTLALNKPMNIDDMLFKYGVRINSTIIQDIQCAVIPINTAISGQKPKFVPAPWIYFPLISPSNKHVITKNLNMVKGQFVNVIDTVNPNKNIKKTVILNSSPYSRFINAPALIDLAIINEKINPKRFNKPNLAIGVLMEGTFESVYKNRLSPILTQNNAFDFKGTGDPAKMIVIADGDMIKNQIQGTGKDKKSLPLGFDRYTKQTFGNKEFLLNCINYLSNNKGLLDARAKDFKMRLLDKPKILKQRLKWQLINVIIPVLLVILVGFVYNYFRKKSLTR